jgi:class 3 adenylate cyclase/tetratricopeptide (TPR) repeat protein
MDLSRRLASYVSAYELEALKGPNSEGPSVAPMSGAVLFGDIEGFTTLTESHTTAGSTGAEAVSEILTAHFDIFVERVVEYGGEVLLFVGDAALAFFPFTPEDASEVTTRAAQCALDIHRSLRSTSDEQWSKLRLVLEAGDLVRHRVGGVDGRWLPVYGGDPVTRVFQYDGPTKPGTVAVGPGAWSLIESRCAGVPRHDGAVVLQGVRRPAEPAGPRWSEPPEGMDEALASLVLPFVSERLAAGYEEFLSEVRDLSVVFGKLLGVDPSDPDQTAKLHQGTRIVQEEVNRRSGTLYHLFRDDKGTALVAAFGLPGQARGDDDQARAVKFAHDLSRRLGEVGLDVAIGVGTGPVFCGEWGPNRRRHYGIVSRTVNLAARLMQAAGAGRVLCDHSTRSRSDRWLAFEPVDAVTAKGFPDPVPVYEPTGRIEAKRAEEAPAEALFGRKEETERLRRVIDGLRDRNQGGVLVLEGEAGVGKSALFRALRGMARESGLTYLAGEADPIERNTAYYAYRTVFESLLGVTAEDSVPEALVKAERSLEGIPGARAELAPLLDTVLPVDLPDNELTRQMSGAIRAENLSVLLQGLIRRAASESPVLLALEDLHWMDQASLQLTADLARRVPELLLVLNTRPMESPTPEHTQLSTGAGRERVVLDRLDPEAIIDLVRRRLGARALPVALKDLILDRAEGNPFYSEELALALLESGAIRVEDGTCKIDEAIGDLAQLGLPGSVKGVITSRIDRLDPGTQLTVKVASVAGRLVEEPLVERIHPVPDDAPRLSAHFETLNRVNLLLPQEGEVPTHLFRHALTHETTYGLLSQAQREPLHRAAAEYIETEAASDLAPFYARLAYHWLKGEVPRKAIKYLSLAGDQALGAYANRAAVRSFSQALELDLKLRGPLKVDLQRARWHRQLCEAHYSLVERDRAVQHGQAAVELCGFATPRFGLSTPIQVTRHLLSRNLPGLFRPDPGKLEAEERDRCIEALRAADLLQVIHLWRGDKLHLAHTVFEGINIAERAGPSAESGFARAMIGYLLMMAGVRKVALKDLHEARSMAEEAGQILQMVSTNMYLGMSYSLLGQPEEGIPYLERADELAGRLGAGLWKHRGKFMLAEPNLMLGRLDVAQGLWAECAVLARGPEPPITGFANGMRALCWIRSGRVQDGLDLIQGPTGIQLVRDNPSGLQLYTCLAAIIEGSVWSGDLTAGLKCADEALDVASSGDDCNTFLNGYVGHFVVTRFFLTLLERRRLGHETPGVSLDDSALLARARRSLKNFQAGARAFPAEASPYLVCRGHLEWLQGKVGRAMKTWQKAARIADAMSMPFEKAVVRMEMGRHNPDAQGTRFLDEARQAFEILDMPLYAALCVPDDAAPEPT